MVSLICGRSEQTDEWDWELNPPMGLGEAQGTRAVSPAFIFVPKILPPN